MFSTAQLIFRSTMCRRHSAEYLRRNLSLVHNTYSPDKLSEHHFDHPVVMLHGLFGSKQNHRSIGKALARDLGTEVYTLDLRNHGESPHDETHDYVSMADDVEAFLRSNSLSPATLIGHSMGAKVAMAVSIRSPSQVASLVSVDNAPVDAILNSDFQKYINGMRKVLDLRPKNNRDAEEILKEFEESPSIRQFLMTNLIRDRNDDTLTFRIPINTLSKSLGTLGDFPFKDPTSQRYEGRTLFVRGIKSHYVADDVLPLIGQFFPSFELVDVDCGHWVISEKPEEFKHAVVDFLLREN